MKNGWVAIVGSVDEGRRFDPPVETRLAHVRPPSYSEPNWRQMGSG